MKFSRTFSCTWGVKSFYTDKLFVERKLVQLAWPFLSLILSLFANGSGDWVQSQVESYQRLKNWYLIPPCLTFSIIRYVSRVKWSNPGNGVVPSPTPRCSSYWKGSLRVALDYGCQLYLLIFWETCKYSRYFNSTISKVINEIMIPPTRFFNPTVFCSLKVAK